MEDINVQPQLSSIWSEASLRTGQEPGFTSSYPLHGLLKVLLVDAIGNVASSNESGLVADVSDVST